MIASECSSASLEHRVWDAGSQVQILSFRLLFYSIQLLSGIFSDTSCIRLRVATFGIAEKAGFDRPYISMI